MAIDEARAAELQGALPNRCGNMVLERLTFVLVASARNTARLKERDEIIRESWVRAMEAKIVRDNMSKCYRLEGVNHNEKCRDLAERYAQMLKENKVRATPVVGRLVVDLRRQVKGYKHIDVE